jgi:hypothetical protein
MAKTRRRFPVKDGVKMRYVGPPRHNPYVRGPVSGQGYNATPGEVVVIDERDVETFEARQWEKVKPPRQAKIESEVKDE